MEHGNNFNDKDSACLSKELNETPMIKEIESVHINDEDSLSDDELDNERESSSLLLRSRPFERNSEDDITTKADYEMRVRKVIFQFSFLREFFFQKLRFFSFFQLSFSRRCQMFC